jgi:hypothetical protein
MIGHRGCFDCCGIGRLRTNAPQHIETLENSGCACNMCNQIGNDYSDHNDDDELFYLHICCVPPVDPRALEPVAPLLMGFCFVVEPGAFDNRPEVAPVGLLTTSNINPMTTPIATTVATFGENMSETMVRIPNTTAHQVNR